MSLTPERARAVTLQVLQEVAPEIDPRRISDEDDLTERLDLDSMDMRGVFAGLHRETGIEIPERDYGKMTSLHGFISYLTRRSGAGSGDMGVG